MSSLLLLLCFAHASAAPLLAFSTVRPDLQAVSGPLVQSDLTYRAASGNVTRQIYIIRHGEKKWSLGCLNGTGESRAKNLISVFNGSRFSTPRMIFANRYDDPIDCERCVQTVTPLAEHLSLRINNTYGYPPWIGGNSKAAGVIKQVSMSLPTGSAVLAAWEHVNIQFLAQDLGVPKSEIPSWDGSNYGQYICCIYIIYIYDTYNMHNNIRTSGGLRYFKNRTLKSP